MNEIISYESIEQKILLIRGKKVMLGTDLAALYKVQTKVLNQAVKRNINRFPEDFMFQLTKKEKKEVVTNCDHLKNLQYSPYLPYAFTEHGALMLANVLNSPFAMEASIHVIRAFIRFQKIISSNVALARKIKSLEKKYDEQFRVVFEAIYKLMEPSELKKKGEIGFER